MAKGLGDILKDVLVDCNLKGLSIYHIVDPFTHNQFFYDMMLMGFPIAREVRAFRKIHDNFMEASNTSINHLKSYIL